MLPMKRHAVHATDRSSHRKALGGVSSIFLAAFTAAAGAQSTIGDAIQNQIDSQVESTVSDSLQQSVDAQVQSTVDQQVQSTVDQQVQSAVDQQVQSGVEQQVESGVEQQVQSAVEQQVESGVTSSVEGQIETGVEGAVEQHVEKTLEGAAGAALDAGEGLQGTLGQAAGAATGATGVGASGGSASSSSAPASNRAARFVAAVDAAGRTIERNVWIILVPAEHVDRIDSWGFDIQERRALPGLDRVLLRVTAPEDRNLAEAALQLALDAPGTRVDYNHVYRPEDRHAAGAVQLESRPVAAPRAEGLSVGIVDGAVSVDHEALRGARIVQEDFVPVSAPRPTAHGTAVASILVGQGGPVRGRLPGATLHAACVFFDDGSGNMTATTESLVEALAWLDAEDVPVINMSLAGPPNAVLEAAVDVVSGHGKIIVAAVGNDGPAAPPEYPAAYRSVIGVTAVDAVNRVYRYANRGPQVMFAAPGVGVGVAVSGGAYGTQTGTSMAAPYAAAAVVRALAHGRSPQTALAALEAAAVDLGPRNYDDIYGFGLIVDPDGGA